MSVAVAIIAAIANNGVIGSGDHIPWRLPGDSPDDTAPRR